MKLRIMFDMVCRRIMTYMAMTRIRRPLVELCYGGDVNFWEAYNRFTWYHAYLCQNFGLNPKKDIVSHKTLDPARKIDPENVLGNKVLNFSSFSRCLSDVRFV